MKLVIPLVLLGAASPVVEAQQPGPPGSGPALQQCLELTSAQVDALLLANKEYWA